MSSHNQQEINEAAAAAMHSAENPQAPEYPVEAPRQKSQAEKEADERAAAAADAMRRADNAYDPKSNEL